MHPTCSYLVCATPRSGSTLLCEALTNSGVAGYPKEYFEALKATGLPMRPKDFFTTLHNPRLTEMLEAFAENHDSSAPSPLPIQSNYADYLAHVLEAGTTPNGVFGAKVMWGYLGDFISFLRDIPAYHEMPVPDLLSTIFPNLHYIQVVRRDKVSQAVSLWKAIQTGTWREDEERAGTNGGGHQKRELQFHFEPIDHLVQQIKEHELAWEHFFNEAGVKPYRVVYEDLVKNYEATALNILNYLGMSLSAHHSFAERRMKRQADALSQKWVKRYHELKREYVELADRFQPENTLY